MCAICGAREADGADIRVCYCEKCGGPRALCLEHARKQLAGLSEVDRRKVMRGNAERLFRFAPAG